jgi:uncharacterized membrane protein
MKWIEKSAMFLLGGVGYVSLEILWRGWSHFSMFLAGGSCFLLLGWLDKMKNTPLWLRGILGSAVITGVELVTGLIFNRNFQVWDYRSAPLNFMGQICLPFTLLGMPISVGAMLLYRTVEGKK